MLQDRSQNFVKRHILVRKGTLPHVIDAGIVANIKRRNGVEPVSGAVFGRLRQEGELSRVRGQQIIEQLGLLVDYLLTTHPTEFTFLAQSCEDRTGHWLYPISPFNVGYNPSINNVRQDAFPNQYVAFDKVLGSILKHIDDDTYLIIFSDDGINPLHE